MSRMQIHEKSVHSLHWSPTARCHGPVVAMLSVIGLVLFCPALRAAGPGVSETRVTDVTTRAFSVVWIADEPSTPDLRVFLDANGTQPATGAVIETEQDEAGLAASNGVMKATAYKLDAATPYYFQTRTASILTLETTAFPATGPFPSVTTETRIVRTYQDGDVERLFANDVVVFASYLPGSFVAADGTLVILEVEGGSYPLSAFVGNGIASPRALIDLNNLFDTTTHQTKRLLGGEPMAVTQFLGIHGVHLSEAYPVPINRNMMRTKDMHLSFLSGGEAHVDIDVVKDVTGQHPDKVLIEFPTQGNRVYHLEQTDGLQQSWQVAESNLVSGGPILQWVDEEPDASERFYRTQDAPLQ